MAADSYFHAALDDWKSHFLTSFEQLKARLEKEDQRIAEERNRLEEERKRLEEDRQNLADDRKKWNTEWQRLAEERKESSAAASQHSVKFQDMQSQTQKLLESTVAEVSNFTTQREDLTKLIARLELASKAAIISSGSEQCTSTWNNSRSCDAFVGQEHVMANTQVVKTFSRTPCQTSSEEQAMANTAVVAPVSAPRDLGAGVAPQTSQHVTESSHGSAALDDVAHSSKAKPPPPPRSLAESDRSLHSVSVSSDSRVQAGAQGTTDEVAPGWKAPPAHLAPSHSASSPEADSKGAGCGGKPKAPPPIPKSQMMPCPPPEPEPAQQAATIMPPPWPEPAQPPPVPLQPGVVQGAEAAKVMPPSPGPEPGQSPPVQQQPGHMAGAPFKQPPTAKAYKAPPLLSSVPKPPPAVIQQQQARSQNLDPSAPMAQDTFQLPLPYKQPPPVPNDGSMVGETPERKTVDGAPPFKQPPPPVPGTPTKAPFKAPPGGLPNYGTPSSQQGQGGLPNYGTPSSQQGQTAGPPKKAPPKLPNNHIAVGTPVGQPA